MALEAFRGLKTVSEIAAEYEIHPVMVSNWKKKLLANVPEFFNDKKAKTDKEIDRETELRDISILFTGSSIFCP